MSFDHDPVSAFISIGLLRPKATGTISCARSEMPRSITKNIGKVYSLVIIIFWVERMDSGRYQRRPLNFDYCLLYQPAYITSAGMGIVFLSSSFWKTSRSRL